MVWCGVLIYFELLRSYVPNFEVELYTEKRGEEEERRREKKREEREQRRREVRRVGREKKRGEERGKKEEGR
jgi:hypothetical protein